MTTHDYTKRYWGHDYTLEPINQGKKGHMMGWGRGIKKGDFLLLENGDDSTRYKVDSINYRSDPPDMWSANVTFAPRPSVEPAVRRTRKAGCAE